MSTETDRPDVQIDDSSTRAESAAEASLDPPDDEAPFESPEFGVGGFFPHLDQRDPADSRDRADSRDPADPLDPLDPLGRGETR